MRKSVMIVSVALLVTALALLAAYLMLFRDTGLRSLSAHVAGAPVEIKALTAGPVQFVAACGSQVKKGDQLLKIDVGDPLADSGTDDPQITENIDRLDPQAALVLSGFLSIPESLPQLAAQIEEQLKAIAQADTEVIEQSVTHAQVQLELRKLELKKGRIAEDEARLRELRQQDEEQAALLAQSQERRNALNTNRAELEKRLQTKKMLEAAFASLTEEQQTAFYQAREVLVKLEEAEKEIARSSVSAPEDGTVIKTLLKEGEEAQFGQLALLLAPDQSEAFWVSAVFDGTRAEKIAGGEQCRVEFSAEENFTIPGRVGKKQPTTPDEQSAGQTRFNIILQTDDPALLARLYERQPAVVVLQ
ncbi:MAG: hypothetical protein LBV80_00460 [Deltaproteobacteria bacterium]|nr:hypothetical protein [Deltaproteobacteria bacterium]